MNRLVLASVSALALALPASAALASSDSSCDADWTLASAALDCGSRAFLAPGNDTRVNLLLLLRDQARAPMTGAYPKQDWGDLALGRTFLTWPLLREAYYPAPVVDENAESSGPYYSGSRCDSLDFTNPVFASALVAAKGLSADDRAALASARGNLATACKASDEELKAGVALTWPQLSNPAAQPWLSYLKAGAAFYLGQWGDARTGFAALKGTSDPWLAETAAYMLARTDLNASQEKAIDEWGDFIGPKGVDKALAASAGNLFAAYVKAWPQGRYSASAVGLVRRAHWLGGDLGALGSEYERMLGAVDSRSEAAPRLVEEIDNKYLFADGVSEAARGPLLLATLDLLAMREIWDETASTDGPDVYKPSSFSAATLEAQKLLFAGQPDLFSYLQATHAYYIAKDYKRVLALLPDNARQPAYDALGFSRQVLRGMALAELGDVNEAGFWKELLGGAKGLWQRPTVELGLALNLERTGKLDQVFAPGSPITDPTVREVLLMHSASAPMLRGVAADAARGAHERDVAAFTLLYKNLTRSRFADFAADVKLVRPGATTEEGLYNFQRQEQVPAALFTKGRWSDGFACPAIATTAATLAANPAKVSARLCLGDFLRLNGFDSFDQIDTVPTKGSLGSRANLFGGKAIVRADIYRSVLDSPAATPDEKAYALYRSVQCYAPGGNNSCGGDEVDRAVRRGWFTRLHRDYPKSVWAKKLRLYW